MEKSTKKRVSLEQVTDIIGFRIIPENIDDCYKTLEFYIKNTIVFLVNLKTTFLIKLMDINQFIHPSLVEQKTH